MSGYGVGYEDGFTDGFRRAIEILRNAPRDKASAQSWADYVEEYK